MICILQRKLHLSIKKITYYNLLITKGREAIIIPIRGSYLPVYAFCLLSGILIMKSFKDIAQANISLFQLRGAIPVNRTGYCRNY